MSEIGGLIVPIITPLTSEYEVDIQALRCLCNIQIDAGIDVIFVLGTTGEFYGLNNTQRRLVVETAIDAIEDRIPVLAGISGDSTTSSLEALKYCNHPGISAYVVSTPYFLSYTQDELYDHFCRIFDAVEKPLVLYNYPGRYRHIVGIELIAKLLEEKRVFAIKDTQGDLDYMKKLLELKKSYPEFLVFEGALENLAESAPLGIDGSVQALGNLLPHQCATLWKLVTESNWPVLDKCVSKMSDFHHSLENVAIFIAALKGCLEIRGWSSSIPAMSTRRVNEVQILQLKSLLEEYDPDQY